MVKVLLEDLRKVLHQLYVRRLESFRHTTLLETLHDYLYVRYYLAKFIFVVDWTLLDLLYLLVKCPIHNLQPFVLFQLWVRSYDAKYTVEVFDFIMIERLL